MEKRKDVYKEEEKEDGIARIPESADALAAALCADYFRRERAIVDGKVPLRVRMEYEYLNRRIYTAARELCEGEEDALGYIEEIGARRGYAKSRFTVSEKTYKVVCYWICSQG